MDKIEENLMRYYARCIIRSHARDIEYNIAKRWLEEQEGRSLTDEEWSKVKSLLDTAMVTIHFPEDLDEIIKVL